MRILLCIRNKIRICVNFIEYTQQKSHFCQIRCVYSIKFFIFVFKIFRARS